MKRRNLTDLIFATGIVCLGLLILADSFNIQLGVSYDRIGPRFFPYIVAAGLLITGLLMLIDSLRGDSGVGNDASPVNMPPFLLLMLALVLCVLLLDWAGFILAVSIQFWLVARAFNSRRPMRDAIIGCVLAITVYYSFTSGLGLVLPRGILSGLI